MGNLNASQQEAVDYHNGHLLIQAGPGTGKTHTLTHRIAAILNSQKNSCALAITFTNKAAEEMRARLDALGISGRDHVFVGTFHQFCLSILRDSERRAPAQEEFSIATEEQILATAQDLWKELSSRQRKILLERISFWKAQEFDQEPFEEARAFNRALTAARLWDFDDILREAYSLLKADAACLEEIRAKFQYIFVDEYQDINRIQHELLVLLAGKANVLTAIGDPNQSIYGFRGSEVKYFDRFEQDFAGAQKLKLDVNYRSARNLLDASTQVISSEKDVSVPEMTAHIYQQGRLIIHHCPTDKAEAEYAAHQIEKMVGGMSMFSQDSGRVDVEEDGVYGFGDIAVLYRLKGQAYAFCKAFDRLGIPFHMCKKKNRYLEETDAEDFYLRPEEADLEPQKVSVMTLHASKGLEFPVVFIVGCEENILPLRMEGRDCDPREERRLFYVGMTRAKEKLYLLSSRKRRLFGRKYENKASPFLKDIEEELKEYEKQQIRTKKKQEQQISFL